MMSEFLKQENSPQDKEPLVSEDVLKQTEMPKDLIEPEGKYGKWSEVIEDKKLGVRYRERIIELPKKRQEEIGIIRIIRRELLLPLPEGIYHEDPEGEGHVPRLWDSSEKLDDMYKFLTDNRYPAEGTFIHTMNWRETQSYTAGREKEDLEKFKKGGMYFQKIGDRGVGKNSNLWLSTNRMIYPRFNTPVFVFSLKNKEFAHYFNQSHPDYVNNRDLDEIELNLGIDENDSQKPLRWCHADLALVPTKRSLNILFFETGDEDRR